MPREVATVVQINAIVTEQWRSDCCEGLLNHKRTTVMNW